MIGSLKYRVVNRTVVGTELGQLRLPRAQWLTGSELLDRSVAGLCAIAWTFCSPRVVVCCKAA